MKWITIAIILVLVVACFYPWVTIEGKDIMVSGFESRGTSFGAPGIIHCAISFIFVLFILIGKVWSLRTAFFINVVNIAWGLRNFVIISACAGGICPTKHIAIYLVLLMPILASISSVFVMPKEMKKAKKQ